MKKIPHRVFYDQDGEIIAVLWGMEGDVKERKELKSINFLDVDFDEIDPMLHLFKNVNVKTKELIIEKIQKPETEQERRIRELEDALLLELEIELGGIM